jgi:heme peroxidase/tetratricopeptide repeat protein
MASAVTSQFPSECPFFSAPVPQRVDMARQVLEAHRPGASLEAVEATLKDVLALDPEDSQGAHALLGLCYGKMGRWAEARDEFDVALELDPKNESIQKLRAQAAHNTTSDIANELRTDLFEDGLSLKDLKRDQPIVAALRERGVDLPDVRPLPPATLGYKFGRLTSRIAGSIIGALIAPYVRFTLRNGPEPRWDESINQGKVKITNLLATRMWDEQKKRLQDRYPAGQLIDDQPVQKRPAIADRVQIPEGFATDDPREGARGTRMGDFGIDPIEKVQVNRAEDRTLPNPFLVSQTFLHPIHGVPRAKAPFLNKTAIWWIQPLVHDLVNRMRDNVVTGKTYSYELPEDHPIRKLSREAGAEQKEVVVQAMLQDPTRPAGTMSFVNEVSGRWDCSHIYGSDTVTQTRLRTGPDGKKLDDGYLALVDFDGKFDKNGFLPIDPLTGREMSGMTRNWWAGPQAFQTLLARHHNWRCDQLKQTYPDMNSDELFEEAKKGLIKDVVRLHTNEWTTGVLPEEHVVAGLWTNTVGLLQAHGPFQKAVEDRKMFRAWRPDHPLFGLIGGRRNDHSARFNGEPNIFLVAYLLHEAVSDTQGIWHIGDAQPSETLPIEALREKGARKALESMADGREKDALATLFNSGMHEKMDALVNNNLPEFMTHMSTRDAAMTDIGALDVIRTREAFGYGYQEACRQLGLPQLTKFEDLFPEPTDQDRKTIADLKRVYGEGPEGLQKLDIKVGMRCDRRRPLFGFDQMMFAIFEEFASRRIQADPDLTERANSHYHKPLTLHLADRLPRSAFTQEVREGKCANGKPALQMTTDGQVANTGRNLLLLHAPELLYSDLVKNDIRNIFEPVNTTYEQAPEEHPLRKFEKYS